MKRSILPWLFLLFICGASSCDKDRNKTTLCNCTGQFYRFKAGGSTLVYPNAFTPNGDGRNDVFKAIYNSINASGYNLTVYNGNKDVIFTTTDINSGWDGFIDGARAPAGRYEATFSATTVSGNLVQSCTCVTIVEYATQFGCIQAAAGSYQFPDQFDIGSGEPSFQTTEQYCP